MLLNLADVVTDLYLGVPTWHIIEEGLIVLAAAVTVTYLVIEMRRRARQLENLTQTLSHTDRQMANITQELRNARQQYSESHRIHKPMPDWLKCPAVYGSSPELHRAHVPAGPMVHLYRNT